MIEYRAKLQVGSTTVVGKDRFDAIALIVVSLLEDTSFFASSATQFTSYTRCQIQDMHRKPCTLFLCCQTSFLRAAAADTMLFSGFMQRRLGAHIHSFWKSVWQTCFEEEEEAIVKASSLSVRRGTINTVVTVPSSLSDAIRFYTPPRSGPVWCTGPAGQHSIVAHFRRLCLRCRVPN